MFCGLFPEEGVDSIWLIHRDCGYTLARSTTAFGSGHERASGPTHFLSINVCLSRRLIRFYFCRSSYMCNVDKLAMREGIFQPWL